MNYVKKPQLKKYKKNLYMMDKIHNNNKLSNDKTIDIQSFVVKLIM